MTEDHSSLAELSRMAQDSTEAYLAGDLNTYARVLTHTDDFTLMPPFGGPTRNGFVLDDESCEATRSTSMANSFFQDVVRGALIVVAVLINTILGNRTGASST